MRRYRNCPTPDCGQLYQVIGEPCYKCRKIVPPRPTDKEFKLNKPDTVLQVLERSNVALPAATVAERCGFDPHLYVANTLTRLSKRGYCVSFTPSGTTRIHWLITEKGKARLAAARKTASARNDPTPMTRREEILKAAQPCEHCGLVPPVKVLAKRFGTSTSTVSRILSGKTKVPA